MTTSDDLHRLISDKENVRVDFKVDATEDVLRGFSTDVASFANTQGGTIIFGVTDDGDPLGCKLTQVQRDRISQEMSKCHPIINADFEEVSFGTRKFFVVKIPKSRLIHNDHQRRFPVRIGNITEYLDASGLVSILQERAVVSNNTAVQIPQEQAGRKTLPSDDALVLTNTLRNADRTIRLEALKDLATMPYWFALFENEDLASAVGQILTGNDLEEEGFVLESLRGIAHAGSEKEKTVLRGWFPRIEELANSGSPDLVRKSFDVLQSARSSGAVRILEHCVREIDDVLYSQLQLTNSLANIGYYGLKDRARKSMYTILGNSPDARTRKRATEILEVLRRTPG